MNEILKPQERLECPHSYYRDGDKTLRCTYGDYYVCDGQLYHWCMWDMDEDMLEKIYQRIKKFQEEHHE